MARNNTTKLTIVINGKEVDNTLKGVGKSVGELKRELRDLNVSDPKFKQKKEELEKAQKAYAAIKREIDGMPSLFDRVNKSAGGLIATMGLAIGFDALIGKLSDVTQKAKDLSDAQAGVMKTTGMTKQEIDELSLALDNLNTRTSKLDLLKIAEEGGRLGLPKEEIEEFVLWMDRSVVALGDSFSGGVEEIASTLGKLKMMFKETSDLKVGEAYNQIGSAINELGANGVATEKNIAEFATRVGSMPGVLKPSIAEALALGAAFEESGIDAEIASRAYSIVLQRASSETAEFAKVMGMPVEEVKKMINANPLEFFLKFAEKLKGINPEATEMSNILNKLKINADGANKVMGAASNNTARFRESIGLANTAMKEGTSLTNEFNTKNDNLAGTIEKIQKKFEEIATNPVLIEWITSVIESFGFLIGAFDNGEKKASAWQKTLLFTVQAITTVVVSLASYKAGLMLTAMWTDRAYKSTLLYNIAMKAKEVMTRLTTIATASYNLVLALYQGNAIAAARAQIALNTAMKANPLGVILSLITLVVGAWVIYKNTVKDAEKATKALSAEMQVNAEYQKNLGAGVSDTQSKIRILTKILQDESTALDTRKKAYQELIKISPDFVGTLDSEFRATNRLTDATTKYIAKLKEAAYEKAANSIREKRAQEKADAAEAMFNAEVAAKKEAEENEKRKKLNEKKATEAIKEISTSTKENAGLRTLAKMEDEKYEAWNDLQAARAKFNEAQRNEKSFEDWYADQIKKGKLKVPTATTTIEEPNGTVTDSPTDKKNTVVKKVEDADAIRKKYLEELRKDTERVEKEILEIKRQSIDIEMAMLEDNFDTQKTIENEAYKRRIEDVEREQSDVAVMLKTAETKYSELKYKNPETAAAYKKYVDELTTKNAELKNILVNEEKKHVYNILQINREANLKYQKDYIDGYSKDKESFERRQNEELAAIQTIEDAKNSLRSVLSAKELKQIKTWEQAKDAVAKKQQKERYDFEIEQLQKMIDEMNRLTQGEVINGIDFSLMTDEQREKVYEEIETLKAKLVELGIAKTNLVNGSEESTDSKFKNLDVDILGFSPEQWENAFSNLDTLEGKIAAAEMVIKSMMQVWGMLADSQQNALDRQLKKYEKNAEKKKKILQQQLDEGYISQSTYNRKIEELEDDLQRRREENEYRSAMIDWKQNIATIISQTALGVAKAYALSPLTFGMPWSGVIAGIGAMQLGLVTANKPKRGYFKGGPTVGLGYKDETGQEVAGTVHADEYVIPEWLRSDPVIARMEEFIEAKRTGRSISEPSIKGKYAQGGEVTPIVMNNSPEQASPDISGFLEKGNLLLEKLLSEGVRLSRTMEGAKLLSEDLNKYNSLMSQQKKS